MQDFDLQSKLAAVEADLVSAAAHGERPLLAEMQTKLCELQLDDADRDAILTALTNASAVSKAANFVSVPKAPGGGMLGSVSPNLMKALTLGTMIAGPAAAGAKWLMRHRAKDKAWQGLQAQAPELVQTDPQRAQAMFDLIHSTAPNLARNPSVTKDLMTQMMDMPMVDLGTVSSLARAGKDLQRPAEPGLGKTVSEGVQAGTQGVNTLQSLVGPKTAALHLPVRHIAEDGTPCVFDWSREPMKKAGITDAFVGGGTMMQQADNAMQMNEEQKGLSLLPLDAVVRELLTKEQELAQREQILQQQEAQLQQAMTQMQGMGDLYQQQYGVSPQGEALPEEDPAGFQEEEGASAFPEEGMPEGGDPTDATNADTDPETGLPPDNGEQTENGEFPPDGGGEEQVENGEQTENGEFPPDGGGEEQVENGEQAENGELPPGNGEELPPGNGGELPPDDSEELPPGNGEEEPEEEPEEDTVPPGEGGDPDDVPGGEQEADDPTVGGTEEADTTGFPPEAGHPELVEAPEDEETDDGDPSEMEPGGGDAVAPGELEEEGAPEGEDADDTPEMEGEEAGGGPAAALPAEPGDGADGPPPLEEDPSVAGGESAVDDMAPPADAALPPGEPSPEAVPGGDAGGLDGEPGVPTENGFTVRVPLPSLEVTVKMAEEEAALKMAKARQTFASTIADLFRP